MEIREQRWAEAMRAGRRGDAAAYERLLGEIAQALRGMIRRRLVRAGFGGHETEDLVQEVLIGLHLKRHSWEEDRPFLPWLHAIARYKLTDACRRLRREALHRRDISDEQWSNLFEAPEDDTDRGLVDLERHMNSLPPGQRDVVNALAVEGASVKATAERLRTSEGAVRVTLHRALRRLASAARLELTGSSGDRM